MIHICVNDCVGERVAVNVMLPEKDFVVENDKLSDTVREVDNESVIDAELLSDVVLVDDGEKVFVNDADFSSDGVPAVGDSDKESDDDDDLKIDSDCDNEIVSVAEKLRDSDLDDEGIMLGEAD